MTSDINALTTAIVLVIAIGVAGADYITYRPEKRYEHDAQIAVAGNR